MTRAGAAAQPTAEVGPARHGTAGERILGAARRALQDGPLPPLAAIAAAAGVSRATLHRHFRSRAELLRVLAVEPDRSAHDRILAEAVALIGEAGSLAGLSMDELAGRAEVSRASLYRIFPGKPVLFREVVRANAPFIPIARALADHAGEPAEVVMRAVARAGLHSVDGREGLLRTILLEFSGRGEDAELARELAFAEFIGPMLAYLAAEMAAGRLRRMDPRLAMLLFAGPLVMYLTTRELTRRALGLDTPIDAVADEMAAGWLRAMRPTAEDGG